MDLYKLLKLKKTATQDQIKKAYRTLSKQWHPDRNPGNDKAAEKFRDITTAYQVLSNEERREKYDKTGVYTTSVHTKDALLESIIKILSQTLINTLQKLAQEGEEVDEKDVLHYMQDNLDISIKKVKESQDNILEGIKVVQKAMNRFKTEEEENLMESMLRDTQVNSQRAVESLEQDLISLKEAKLYLAKYKYDFKKPMQKEQGLYEQILGMRDTLRRGEMRYITYGGFGAE